MLFSHKQRIKKLFFEQTKIYMNKKLFRKSLIILLNIIMGLTLASCDLPKEYSARTELGFEKGHDVYIKFINYDSEIQFAKIGESYFVNKNNLEFLLYKKKYYIKNPETNLWKETRNIDLKPDEFYNYTIERFKKESNETVKKINFSKTGETKKQSGILCEEFKDKKGLSMLTTEDNFILKLDGGIFSFEIVEFDLAPSWQKLGLLLPTS